ncbi:hypothetical protein GCM10012280_22630 [Wenjunlia tyrosinilytica]|uniref:Uncharacterized protein n=1 Tax=Wenjunlia tyrosinilytica TaxID=1544741 RepID=A0A917ZLJ3_9ACTN|nr:hypothetical protein GCM10012280_22630 [Wenjunlia tyrosinilytica]
MTEPPGPEKDRTWKGPAAGDGGCTSDRAVQTVTRDRPFANSGGMVSTSNDVLETLVVTGLTSSGHLRRAPEFALVRTVLLRPKFTERAVPHRHEAAGYGR